FHSHDLRISRGYRSGYIDIKFNDRKEDLKNFKIEPNYEEEFNENPNGIFVKNFEKKFNIKLIGSDGYFFHFKCEPGKERETIERLSELDFIRDVDFIDARKLNDETILRNIGEDLINFSTEFDHESEEYITKYITDVIEELKGLLK
ncbi:MAG: hypothetical protein KDH96_11875, partial [Candidatus Riesia sp.]|nr:hypothetical protein [Candidatus Riesia sp.]